MIDTYIEKKRTLHIQNSKCKGLEVGEGMKYSKNSKEAIGTGV
jgi:hypothetical protein